MVGDVVVTFETLFDLVRREKELFELQKLDARIFSVASVYLAEKVSALDAASRKSSLFSEAESAQLGIQVANIRKVLKELYDRRDKKIVEMAVNRARTNAVIDGSSMLPDEKNRFESLVGILRDSRVSFLVPILEGRRVAENGTLVRFVAHVDAFIGKELENYGPFEADQSARLPQDIASILVNTGKAVQLDNA